MHFGLILNHIMKVCKPCDVYRLLLSRLSHLVDGLPNQKINLFGLFYHYFLNSFCKKTKGCKKIDDLSKGTNKCK